MVNKLIEPNSNQAQKQVYGIEVRGWEGLNAEDLYSLICKKATNVFQSVRLK